MPNSGPEWKKDQCDGHPLSQILLLKPIANLNGWEKKIPAEDQHPEHKNIHEPAYERHRYLNRDYAELRYYRCGLFHEHAFNIL